MSRRVSLPGADELFRATQNSPPVSSDDQPAREPSARKSSGRVRHDEKITVYVTADELVDLEHIRLMLRREHGVGVDRGRLVREAIQQAIEDVEAHGCESALLRRLRQQ